MKISRAVLEVALDTLYGSCKIADRLSLFSYDQDTRLRCALRLHEVLHDGMLEIEECGEEDVT